MKTFRRHMGVSAAALLAAAGMAHAQAFSENFDDITQLPGRGWFEQNNSVPGLIGYFQGNLDVFGPHASAGYLGVNYNSTSGLNTISNWMVAPVANLHNGDVISFFTRTVDAPFYPDRLQVRLSTNGSSTNVGTTANDVGDFTTLLLDINPTYGTSGFPNSWTNYTITLSGLPAAGVSGRFAFRYFVENAGPSGANSDYIGIDTVDYVPVGTPTGACCLETGCTVLTQAQCTSQGGTYRGNGVACATANCPPPSIWNEQGDAGSTTNTAQIVTTPGGAGLTQIRGTLADGTDADMYQILICDRNSFSATTVGGTGSDTQLFLFDSSGHGVTADDDDPGGAGLQSTISNQFVAASGVYYLAISSYDNDPLGATTSGEMWLDQPFNVERQPDGPAATEAQGSFDGAGGDSGGYTIRLTGSCFVSAASLGACCLPDGSCGLNTQAGCTSAGGIFRGLGTDCSTANCPQPPTGACCLETSCQVLTQAQCTAQQGTYRGNNVTCAAANCPISPVCNGGFESGQFGPCWTQFGDTSFSAVHTGTFLLPPHGGTHAAHFGPTSSNGGIMQTLNGVSAGTPVTVTFWYAAQGSNNFFSADLGTTNLTSFTNDTGHPDWTQFTFTVPAPTANPVLTFTFFNPPSYDLLDDVSVTVGTTQGCYANCDHSTNAPILNVNDFICFQAAFAAGASYANCDGSTNVPVLNVNDFICFQTQFAGGCTAP